MRVAPNYVQFQKLWLGGGADRVDDVVLLLDGEEAGDVARVQNVVDVLQERLVDDLGVDEEEGHPLARGRARRQLLESESVLTPALATPPPLTVFRIGRPPVALSNETEPF